MKDEGGRLNWRRGTATAPRRRFILLFVSGCAHYEYDVVEPPDLAGGVGSKSWVALRRADAFDEFGPRYYSIYDPNDRTYFDWGGESTMRFLFTFEREGGERIRHEFVIRRRKV